MNIDNLKTPSLISTLFALILAMNSSYGAANQFNTKAAKPAPVKYKSNMTTNSKFTGAYIGGGIGLQLSKIDMKSTASINIPGSTNIITNSNPNINSPSFAGKIYLGYSTLFKDKYYLGLEGRAVFENINATNNIIYQEQNSSFLLQRNEKVSLNKHFSLVLKPGTLVQPDTLIYANIGATLAKILFKTNASYSQNLGSIFSANTSTEQNSYKLGLLVGLGLEKYITKTVSTNLEYNFIYFGNIVRNKDASSSVSGGAAAGSEFTANTERVKMQMNTLTIGLTYHLS